jgi:hypothetical protein
MIRVWTPFRNWFNVKNPEKIKFWKTLAFIAYHKRIIIREK